MISDEIKRRWGGNLPVRAHHALIYSDFKSLDEVKAAFENKREETIVHFLRIPNCGRTTLNIIMSALDVSSPKAECEHPNFNRVYVTAGEHHLSQRERQLISRLISAHLTVDPDSSLREELIKLRNRI